MGRPENPIDPQDGPIARFAHELRKLRDEAGAPAYRAMARRAGYSGATLSQAAGGERLPTLPVLLAYVTVCRGDTADWQHRWERANAELLRLPRPADQDTEPPYRGLARFEPDDADLFFGRDHLIDDLLELARNRRVTALVGASGSGKSSLLRAGLVPRLRHTDQPAPRPAALRIITPGTHPLRTHEQRLTPATTTGGNEGAATWLIVDQFEEIFTLCRDPAERTAFIDRLLTANNPDSRLRVLIAIRADFYNRCLEHHNLITVLRDATMPVGPMNADELREAIVKPATARGLIVERGLTARILQDIDGEPGALPLMSHALLETWRRRRGKALTEAAYDAADGLHGAITHTAETAYTTLTPAQAVLARRILLRLITPGEGTQDTRRPVDRTELDTTDPTDTNAVLERLTSARLLTVDGPTIDLAHEALITAWPRLRRWIDEDRERLRIHRQLTEATHIWNNLDHDPGALYRGTRLATAEETFATPHTRTDLTLPEQEFLTTSTTTRHHEEHNATRTTRRLRRLTTTLAVLLALALTAGTIAWDQYRTSDKERRRAVAAQQVFLSQQAAAQSASFRADRPDLASLLAVHAYKTQRTKEAAASLFAAAELPLQRLLAGHDDNVWSVAISSDGRTLATGGSHGDEGTLRVWDITTGRIRTTLARHTSEDGSVGSVVFSPDGRTLASSSSDGTTQLWNMATGKTRLTLAGHKDVDVPLAFSPDGRTLAMGGEGKVRLWDTTRGRLRTTLNTHTVFAESLAFSPDGRTLAMGGEGKVRLWDTTRGRLRTTLNTHTDILKAVAFSPDGLTLASGGGDGSVTLWDTRTGKFRVTINALNSAKRIVRSVAFSPDGRMIATGGDDTNGKVRLWDVATGSPRAVLIGHSGPVMSVAFSSDGHSLVSGSYDGTTRLWAVTININRTRAILRHAGRVSSVTYSPDGRTLISGVSGFRGEDGTVRLWDAMTGNFRTTLSQRIGGVKAAAFRQDGTLAIVSKYNKILLGNANTGKARTLSKLDEEMLRAAFSPGARLLAGSGEGVSVREVPSGRTRYTLDEQADFVSSMAFSPDERTLATGADDGTVVLRDAATGHPRTTLTGHTSGVETLAFSPDGRTLASGSSSTGNTRDNGTIRLWDVMTGKLRTTFDGALDVQSVVFSPDGQTLASGTLDGTARLWDVTTGNLRATLTGHTNGVSSLAFSPDGRTLASGGEDGTVRLWDVDLPGPAEAITRICRAVHRDLTPQERSLYLKGHPIHPLCTS
ncbi:MULTISPECIES: helix-turn-helix domain-containing protein [unclassified Streptomyces]|uniref:nSTAND1 domain-containing NTPase n=1 Tax=unclassified Streptomyces TaxID=2593676 RepID=UPI002B1CAA97|nr:MULTISPECIES: helix-turn-helix domain-containing protein [unclassified Streptomyces]